MYKILIIPKAKDDLAGSIKWYKNKAGEYTSDRFKKCVFETIETLKNDLIENAKISIGLNRVIVKKFPFIIYYLKEENTIIIFGVLHNKRSKTIIEARV